MSVITVVTRIFPLNAQFEDAPNLLKPNEIGKPVEVHKCIVMDPSSGAKFLLETTFCLGKTKNLENLKIPGLIPLSSLDSALNCCREKEYDRKFAFSVPKNIPLQKIPHVQNVLKSTHLEKPHITLHLNLKKIREATKKKHLIKKKGKLVRPLFKYFIDDECLICGTILHESRKSKIRTHMFSHVKLGTYSCQNCGNKCFSSADALYAHSLQHTEKMDYTCTVCSYKFSRKYFLTCHYEEKHHDVLKHSNRLVTNFMCSICKIKLTSWKAVVDHKNTHFGKESYSCFYCNKTFSASCTLLRYHAHMHLISNYYKCKYCKKTLSSRYKLKEHENIHRTKFLHLCEFCGKKFNFRSNLMKHLQLHSQNC